MGWYLVQKEMLRIRLASLIFNHFRFFQPDSRAFSSLYIQRMCPRIRNACWSFSEPPLWFKFFFGPTDQHHWCWLCISKFVKYLRTNLHSHFQRFKYDQQVNDQNSRGALCKLAYTALAQFCNLKQLIRLLDIRPAHIPRNFTSMIASETF